VEEKQHTIDKMLYHAHRCLYFNEKLIEQSDTWLSAEEGNENLMRQIKKRKRK
jgi:hypothetical protein